MTATEARLVFLMDVEEMLAHLKPPSQAGQAGGLEAEIVGGWDAAERAPARGVPREIRMLLEQE